MTERMRLYAESVTNIGGSGKAYVLFHACPPSLATALTSGLWINYPFANSDDFFKLIFEEWADKNIPQKRGDRLSFRFSEASVLFDNREDALLAYLAFR